MPTPARPDILPRPRAWMAPLLLCLLLLTACVPAVRQTPHETVPAPLIEAPRSPFPSPTLRKAAALAPDSQKLPGWPAFRRPLKASLEYVRTKPGQALAGQLPNGRNLYYGELATVLQDLLELLPLLDAWPEHLFSRFSWVQLAMDFRFTGYYEPLVEASHLPRPGFTYPLPLATPDAGTPPASAWIRSPVLEPEMLLQGSAEIRYLNGESCFAEVIARHLASALEDHRASVALIPSSRGPLGSMGFALTPLVSVATDPQVLPEGLVTFMRFSDGRRLFSGLMLPQDTGGGIHGTRVDVFCGSGPLGLADAEGINATGRVWVLLPLKPKSP